MNYRKPYIVINNFESDEIILAQEADSFCIEYKGKTYRIDQEDSVDVLVPLFEALGFKKENIKIEEWY